MHTEGQDLNDTELMQRNSNLNENKKENMSKSTETLQPLLNNDENSIQMQNTAVLNSDREKGTNSNKVVPITNSTQDHPKYEPNVEGYDNTINPENESNFNITRPIILNTKEIEETGQLIRKEGKQKKKKKIVKA